MKRKEINALIEKVKVFAKENPSGYRQRVFWLGVLGYAYIAVVLLVLALMLGGIGWLIMHHHLNALIIKLLLFLSIISYLIIQSLWIKIPPPEGIPVNKKDAPQLFAVIEDICAKQKSPLPDHVLINNDFNAFISQVPRLGILGWYKNYLVLGLPYMMASDINQFKSVLAHEFGHFSGAHGQSMVWIYRVRLSWENIMANFENQTSNFVFQWFFNWYVPYFTSYAFVLIRQQEYEADRYATAYVGAQANAQELVHAAVKSDVVGLFWGDIWRQVADEESPPQDVYTRAVAHFRQEIPEEHFRSYLLRVFRIRTQNFDTHPALTDRLAGMGFHLDHDRITGQDGQPLQCRRNITLSAAEEFLKAVDIQRMLGQFDKDWYQMVEASWKDRHAQLTEQKDLLAQLNAKAQTTPLTEKETVDRAFYIDQLRPRHEGFAAVEQALELYPENALANYRMGEILIEDNHPKGKDYLSKAMALDNSLSSACLEKIRWYHETQGEYTAVEEALEVYDKSAENDAKDYEERNAIGQKDVFLAHTLKPSVVEDLRLQLKPFEAELKVVYLVEKKLTVYPQEPMYVIAVSGRMKGFHWDEQGFNQKLVNKLCAAIKLKIEKGTVLISAGDKIVNKKAKKIPGAQVFNKK